MSQLACQFTRSEFEARIERFEEDWLNEARAAPPPLIDAYLPSAQLVAEEGYGRRELLVELIMSMSLEELRELIRSFHEVQH